MKKNKNKNYSLRHPKPGMFDACDQRQLGIEQKNEE